MALPIALAALAAAGCNLDHQETTQSSPDAAAPFQFALQSSDTIDLTVVDGKTPVAGAQVIVRVAGTTAPTGEIAPNDPAPDLLFQGMSGPDGHVSGKWSRRVEVENVDVIINHTGYIGPYTFEESRANFGLFRPASWQRVPVAALSNLRIALSKGGT